MKYTSKKKSIISKTKKNRPIKIVLTSITINKNNKFYIYIYFCFFFYIINL